MNTIYSGRPLAIASLPDMKAEEFQHVVYMPVMSPGSTLALPYNLEWARPAVMAAYRYLLGYRCPDLNDWYVYLSVKHGWVDAGTAGNREGWHVDGYGSNGDHNFIWCDSTPTRYLKGTFVVPEDHAGCLKRLAYLGSKAGEYYISEHETATHQLYNLGQTVHQPGIAKVSGMRTFVKVSVSRDKYDLIGNARNPLLPGTNWPLKPREGHRNHPTAPPGNGRAKAYTTATHGIHKGTMIAQPGTEELHNEGSLS